MTSRADNSAPKHDVPEEDVLLADVVGVILSQAHAARTQHPVRVESRAKSLGLEPLRSLPSFVREKSETNVESIQQRPNVQQEISQAALEILEVIDEHGPVIPVRRIAEILDCDSDQLRRGELHQLRKLLLVEAVPGRNGGIRRRS